MKRTDVFALPRWKIAVFLTAPLILAACAPINDGFDASAGRAKNGMVSVSIAVNRGERFALPADKPSQENADYYEAVFREQGAPNYFLGAATAGESYIVVNVPAGKTYDILVLAGTPVNGQASNGVKVLLASGWYSDYAALPGRNTVQVPMKLHATEDCFTSTNAAGTMIAYIPVISGIHALLKAAGTKRNAAVFAGAEARIAPYPDPYRDDNRFPPVTDITANAFMGTLHFRVSETMPPKAAQEEVYFCYYNIGYYAFSDSASGSSRWDLRRGITNVMYTEDGYYGGGIPLRYDQTYYYVKASGNDGNP
ncbi:MAG: hypothetical protein LBG87_05730, partial [Spirochaetaceae bacterium]|nr:hypothetical protein [Spirochaetaceae bacterium]